MRVAAVLRAELTRASRRPWPYLGRVFVAAAMLGAMGLGYAALDERDRPPGLLAAEICYGAFGVVMGVALVVVPGSVAVTIAGDDRRGRLGDLLASPMPASAIVLGAFGSRLATLGALAAVALPVIGVIVGLGAVDPAEAGTAALAIVAAAVFAGSLAMVASVVVPGPRAAVVVAYALVAAWLTTPLWLGPAVRQVSGNPRWADGIENWTNTRHPLRVLVVGIEAATRGRLGDPIAAGFARTLMIRSSRASTVFLGVGSAVLLTLAILLLRPIRLGRWARRRRSAGAPTGRRPPIGDGPMRWKECRLPRSGRWGRLASLGLCTLLAARLAGPVATTFARRAGWPGIIGNSQDLGDLLHLFLTVLYVGGALLVATTAAASVAGERDRGTWTGLAASPLTGREVARAKVAGALRSARPLAWAFVLLGAIGLVTEAIHPVGLLAVAVAEPVFFWAAAAVGVLASMAAGGTDRAVAATLAALAAINLMPVLFVDPNMLGGVAGSWPTFSYAGASWYVVWASPVSVDELALIARTGRWWESSTWVPWRFWSPRGGMRTTTPGLIPIVLASLVLHAVLGLAATRAAARLYEMQRGASRRGGPLSALAMIHQRRKERACASAPSSAPS